MRSMFGGKKENEATIDFGLHMIITDLPEAHLEDMNEMVREGVTSSNSLWHTRTCLW